MQNCHDILDRIIDNLSTEQVKSVTEFLGLTYRSWADTRQQIKQQHPDDQREALEQLKCI